MKNLVIVESPAKAKTLKKFLDNDFNVIASYGHVRDLIAKNNAVEVDNNFKMNYEVIDRNAKHVAEIVRAVKTAQNLYLAPDPDREGEAIAWHIFEILKDKNLLAKKNVKRIAFHEITKNALFEAIKAPREISMDLVNAQQARRALDYLVGFNLSPLLWKKVQKGLSAGRVQSPALRLIVERENEITNFVKQEYWTIDANFDKKKKISARLTKYKRKKVEQFSFVNREQALAVTSDLKSIAQNKLTVFNVDRKQKKRNPLPPFITSTLQQDASRKLGFGAKKTMQIAQKLYEGIDIGRDVVGLITYMRTDSVNLAKEAVAEIRKFIGQEYNADLLPKTPFIYKTSTKNAQEAHEAIRPTSIKRKPEDLEKYLDADSLKLYKLIWQRTLASQMKNALVNTIAVDLFAGSEANVFHLTGSAISDPGFMVVYTESSDEEKKEESYLPNFQEGDVVDIDDIVGNQHFTEPPPRYTEASLIKNLEEYGIGRPSTYATIIATLQQREYVTLVQKRFVPTDIGKIAIKFLTEHFYKYVDYGFTAGLENDLDLVSNGKKEWIPLLRDFWNEFYPKIIEIDSSVRKKEVVNEVLEEKCPECGRNLVRRMSKHGWFIGCSGYPDCKYIKKEAEKTMMDIETIENNVAENNEAESKEESRFCPKCGAKLELKTGRFGKFYGCPKYPECKYIEPLHKPKDTGILCPECKTGHLVQKFTKSKKMFFGCNNYPKCKFATWDTPVAEACPKCGFGILAVKKDKNGKETKYCCQKECDYKEEEK